MGNMESIKKLVLCDAGVAIIPRCCVEQDFRAGLMKEIELSEGLRMPPVEYFIIQRKNEKSGMILNLLFTALKKQYQIVV